MIGLLVTVNDRRSFVAGFSEKDGDGHLSARVVLDKGGMLRAPGVQYKSPPLRVYFEAEGFNYSERRNWETVGLTVGDEITIRVVETESADPTKWVEPFPSELPGFEHGYATRDE
jgi:hypothetical protein